jgi:hypothetical protein
VLEDFDGDSLRDCIVTNGHTDSNLIEMGRDTPFAQPPLVWKQSNRRFEVLGPEVGSYFEVRHPGRARSTADFDNDGDPDIAIGHQDAGPALLRNDRKRQTALGPAIMFQVIGRRSNRDAVGALITLRSGAITSHHQVSGGRSYLSASDLRVMAVCDGSKPANLRIRWPSGLESEVAELAGGRCYAIVEPAERGHSARVVELFNWLSSVPR